MKVQDKGTGQAKASGSSDALNKNHFMLSALEVSKKLLSMW